MVYYFPSNAQKSAHWKRLFSQYRHQDCPGTFLQLRGYCNCKTVCIFSPLLLQYCLSDFLQGLVRKSFPLLEEEDFVIEWAGDKALELPRSMVAFVATAVCNIYMLSLFSLIIYNRFLLP